jgi:hypothetical protein
VGPKDLEGVAVGRRGPPALIGDQVHGEIEAVLDRQPKVVDHEVTSVLVFQEQVELPRPLLQRPSEVFASARHLSGEDGAINHGLPG